MLVENKIKSSKEAPEGAKRKFKQLRFSTFRLSEARLLES